MVAAPALAEEPAGEGPEAIEGVPSNLDQLLQKSAQRPVRVIVRMNIAPALADQPAAADAKSARAAAIATTRSGVMSRLEGTNVSGVRTSTRLPMMAMDVGRDALERLANDPAVVSIQEDVALPPNLPQSVPLIGATPLHNDMIRGEGTVVAVLDTGVDSTHPFFGGRVVEEACFSTTSAEQASRSACPGGADSLFGNGAGGACSSAVSGCSHGTHVAGIAAGAGQAFGGVAPAVDIVAIQVFSIFSDQDTCQQLPAPCALSYVFNQLEALAFVEELSTTHNIAAVNMSLAGEPVSGHCDDDETKVLIDSLREIGVATVVASGNSGVDGAIGAPACISSAVAVGSTTKGEGVSDFSNLADTVDLMAPGSAITSSIPGGGFEPANGTSMAAPHVAGAFALLKSAAPASTVDEIEEALRATGRPVARAGIEKPRVQVDAALEYLLDRDQLACENLISAGNHQLLQEDFGVPYNLFSTRNELTVQADCESGAPVLQVGSNVGVQYVWHEGQIWKDGAWQAVALSGPEPVDEEWFEGSASASLPLDAADLEGEQYTAGYVCHWIEAEEEWKCGCRDSTCSENLWQLQVFRPASGGQMISGRAAGSVAMTGWTPLPPQHVSVRPSRP